MVALSPFVVQWSNGPLPTKIFACLCRTLHCGLSQNRIRLIVSEWVVPTPLFYRIGDIYIRPLEVVPTYIPAFTGIHV